MTIIHKELAAGRWNKFSLMEQLGNVGSDVERAIKWREKGNQEYSKAAVSRALELMDLTIADPKNAKRLKEILIAREVLVDYFEGNNEYKTTDKFLRDYFDYFAFAAAVQRGR